MNPDVLFAPALDCHTGAVPDLGADVELSHTVVFGSDRMLRGARVRFRDWFGWGASAYLCRRVVGDRTPGGAGWGMIPECLPNGDFTSPVADVRLGQLRYDRVKPPAG